MSIDKKLVSDITPITIYATQMYKATLKKENNSIVQEWNKLLGLTIPTEPLTEQEEILAKQFDNYVKQTREDYE